MTENNEPDLVQKTRQVVSRMMALLDNPHPGLFTWVEQLCEEKSELDKLFAKSVVVKEKTVA